MVRRAQGRVSIRPMRASTTSGSWWSQPGLVLLRAPMVVDREEHGARFGRRRAQVHGRLAAVGADLEQRAEAGWRRPAGPARYRAMPSSSGMKPLAARATARRRLSTSVHLRQEDAAPGGSLSVTPAESKVAISRRIRADADHQRNGQAGPAALAEAQLEVEERLEAEVGEGGGRARLGGAMTGDQVAGRGRAPGRGRRRRRPRRSRRRPRPGPGRRRPPTMKPARAAISSPPTAARTSRGSSSRPGGPRPAPRWRSCAGAWPRRCRSLCR